MCGVFGFVGKNGKGRPNLERLMRLALATEQRGPHAFGFAWIDGQGRLRAFRSSGRISDHLGLLKMAEDARYLIGHCRWATQGDPRENINNHPHPADGGWIVHNGVIGSYERLLEERDLMPVSECDSEVLGLLVEDLPGTLEERCAGAVREVEAGPLVMMGLWSRPAKLVIVRRGNPLRMGTTPVGTYFASLSEGMPKGSRDVVDDRLMSFGEGQVYEQAIGRRGGASGRGSATVRSRGDERVLPVPDDGGAEGLFSERGRRTWGF